MSPEAYDLVSRMLDPHKEERIGYEKSKAIYTHCFFKSVDWDNIRMNKVDMPGWTRMRPLVHSVSSVDTEGSTSGESSPEAPVLGVMGEYRKWAQGVGTEKEQKHFMATMSHKFDFPSDFANGDDGSKSHKSRHN